jgi:hypothetical protein
VGVSSDEKWIRVEVISCDHCGRLNVALGNEDGGLRLGGHKCAGAWTRVREFDLKVADFKADVREALKRYAFVKTKK